MSEINEMYEKFIRQFAKVCFREDEKRTLKKLKHYLLKVDKENRRIFIAAVFSSLADKKTFYKALDRIKETLDLSYVEAETRFEDVCFSSECFENVLVTLKRENASVFAEGFFDEAEPSYTDGTFKIKLRDNVEPAILYENGVDIIISNIIKNEYGAEADVIFEGNVDIGYVPPYIEEQEQADRENYQRYLENLSSVAESKLPSLMPLNNSNIPEFESDTTVKAGRMKFDISEKKVLFGKEIKKLSTTINGIKDGDNVSFVCFCFLHEKKDTKDYKKVNHKIQVTDLEASVIVRFTLEKETSVKAGKKAFIIEGKAAYDKFEGELVIKARSINEIKQIRRKDDHPTPRVELHLHTVMSATDGFCDPSDVLQAAEDMNMPAIAFTDHGNIQSYPLVMKGLKSHKNVKPIYGMEGYFVDDTARAIYNFPESREYSLSNDEFVVFDIETTGLSPADCKITEIGAVRYKNGEVLEVFETFVDPGVPIPAKITELTGITDEMVKGAPDQKTAVESFLKFAGDRILIAHNAPFDISFIRKAALDHKLPFNNAYIDTVALSRFINPDLKKHKLDIVADYFHLGTFNHHRASDDTKMLAKIFECLVQKFEKVGVKTIKEMIGEMENKADPKKLRSYHITILVKNKTGLKNLYKIISKSYLDFYYRNPRIPKTVLAEHREGLLIGSACEAGEFYTAVREGKPYADLMKIADFYDYFEIQPHGNNMFLVDKGEFGTDRQQGIERLSNINRQIINIAEKKGKIVVATGDVHFLYPEDEIYRQILCFGLKYSDALRSIPLYLKTTNEMLDDFSYLGKDKAFEVVVTNTRKIADMIDGDIKPIPDGSYSPEIPGAADELRQICFDTAHKMYGDPLPEIVESRLKRELDSVIEHGFSSLYIIARRLVQNSESHGYLVGSRGSVGSSVVAAFSGVSEVNPLPPHYYCPECQYSEFVSDVGSGFDLPDKKCPKCSAEMKHDGHDIPFETFLGFNGDKAPDIDLNFSGDVQSEAHKYTEVLFGKENIFRAGTVSTIADKTAYGFVKKYCEETGKTLTKAEENRLVYGVSGVKKTTGQHPGGIVVIPKQYDIHDFTPIQHPADDAGSSVITTHFAFEFLHDTLLKLDILGHDVPTEYKMLLDFTGIDVRSVPMNDKKVMSLFTSPEALGVTQSAINSETGSFGLPECGTAYVRKMLIATQPKGFSDLVQIAGLSHGTGIWTGNGEELIKDGTCTISEIIGTRDSIMLYLKNKGLDNSQAFKIMEDVRKGKGLKPEYEASMREHDVPEWYIASCKKIEYMFPKAHAAAYMISTLRLGWYKVYQPLAFYAAHFTVKQDAFDAELMLDRARMKETLARLDAEPKLTQKDKELQTITQLVNEMYARGFEFLPVDIYHSEPYKFVPEAGKIRLPLSSLNGLGSTAAQKIYDAVRNGTATTLEELKTEASLTKTVVEILKKNNCLGDLPESNQITFF